MDFTLKWKRPAGPINVWRTKESTKQFKNGKPVKFLIQEIPKDRWEDAVDHMCTYFVEDEPICSTSNVKGDSVAMEEFRGVWRIVMKQGCAIGAFIEDPENEKPILAGMNATHVVSKDEEDKFQEMIVNH